jgi:hypothetical protein
VVLHKEWFQHMGRVAGRASSMNGPNTSTNICASKKKYGRNRQENQILMVTISMLGRHTTDKKPEASPESSLFDRYIRA